MVYRRQAGISGIGIVAPTGMGARVFWDAALNGRSGIRPSSRLGDCNLSCRLAGEVCELKDDPRSDDDRQGRLLSHAIRLCLADAGLSPGLLAEQGVPVVVGVSIPADGQTWARAVSDTAGSATAEAAVREKESLWWLGSPAADLAALQVRLVTITGSWTAGLDALWVAMDWVRSGRYDLILAGAVEAPLNPKVAQACSVAGWLSASGGVPRPFDAARDGWVLSEAAVMFAVESAASALARRKEMYAALAGAGGASAGSAEASLSEAMAAALADGGLLPARVNYVCAWACGDPELDISEIGAIKRAFGQYAFRLAVSSIKGGLGNSFAAGGALQAATAALSIRHGQIPPTANLTSPDPACDLDCVCGKSRKVAVEAALVNALSPGNSSCCVALRRMEAE